MLKANRTVALEHTLGTGLATLLAKNLRLIDIELPEKPYRLDSDIAALPKLKETLGGAGFLLLQSVTGRSE